MIKGISREEKQNQVFNFVFTTVNRSHNVQQIYIRGDWDFQISDMVRNPDGTDI